MCWRSLFFSTGDSTCGCGWGDKHCQQWWVGFINAVSRFVCQLEYHTYIFSNTVLFNIDTEWDSSAIMAELADRSKIVLPPALRMTLNPAWFTSTIRRNVWANPWCITVLLDRDRRVTRQQVNDNGRDRELIAMRIETSYVEARSSLGGMCVGGERKRW